ncbi:MAG: adenosylmethionine--8-amino-7-oxononanoate transaminase [Candidatus Anammoxibacter sp.]
MNSLSKIWYPYSQMKTIDEPYHVVSAEGVSIKLSNGKSLVDGISSWWCMIHGYRHPELDDAMIKQLSKVSHVMLGGLTHDPVLDLTEKLVEITPDGLNHVFYGDSGSIGVEIALKMALQYWRNIGKTGKNKFAALKGAYHGDTFGCMSVCDPEDGMHYLLSDAIIKEYFIDCPPAGFDQESSVIDNYIFKLKKFFEKHYNELAALIVEPVIQTAGGFNIYSPEIIKRMRKLCDDYDILFIFDEVATGFGRTGKYFASDHASACPDIMVLGKALTGGYIGHSATLSTTKIFEAFYGDDHEKAFMHGPTFMGNPLACAVALESIKIFERDNYLDKIKTIEEILKNRLFQINSSKIKDIRVLGAIGVVEVKDANDIAGFQNFAVERGVWLRPFGRFLYTMPPYIIQKDELDQILDVMKKWFG